MRLTMQQRQAAVTNLASRYQRSRKKEKNGDLERVGRVDGIQSGLCRIFTHFQNSTPTAGIFFLQK